MLARRSRAHRRDILVPATARQQTPRRCGPRERNSCRFAAHDDCLDQGDKGSAAAKPLFDWMLNGRRGQPKSRRHGSHRFPAALTIYERCEQQEEQPADATRHHPAQASHEAIRQPRVRKLVDLHKSEGIDCLQRTEPLKRSWRKWRRPRRVSEGGASDCSPPPNA